MDAGAGLEHRMSWKTLQELRQCHCHPKQGEPRAKNPDGGNGGKTYKVEETGMKLRRKSSKQNLTKIPARPAASGGLSTPVLLLRQRIFHS